MDLQTWRHANNLTLEDVAARVGSTKGYIWQIERSERRPSADFAKRIEAATNGEVTAAELLGLADPAPSPGGMSDSPRAFEQPDETVSVTVPGHLVRAAADLGVDIETELRRGGLPALQKTVTAAFRERYKDAIEDTNAYVRKHGTLSQRFGMI